ncbi:MAG: hypothetical protein K5790_06595 [Nitrosopumilus sp.]|uniref:hypothetical protein n=1 Tax=Nitrosopumilus sp. TaxID=2024843 RepID=UPI00247C8CD0|nr:hypothetical protein [Nitrosopumilus sp.]MCV0392946.1 hypothetical protein [Nitrosopumilus sp.]
MKICCGRGTASVEIDISEMPWAGKPFMAFQKEKISSLPKEKKLCIIRGTKSVSLQEYLKSRRKILDEGFSLVISRGTRILRL